MKRSLLLTLLALALSARAYTQLAFSSVVMRFQKNENTSFVPLRSPQNDA